MIIVSTIPIENYQSLASVDWSDMESFEYEILPCDKLSHPASKNSMEKVPGHCLHIDGLYLGVSPLEI